MIDHFSAGPICALAFRVAAAGLFVSEGTWYWRYLMVYKTVALADKRTVTLDWLRKTDLAEVMGVLNSVIREGKYLFMNTEITDMDEEQRWYECGVKEGMRYLVARVEGNVVGGASFHPHAEKRAHVAEFGIFIIDGYRELGLGTALTRELLETAKKDGLEIMQLSVYATNKRAFHVYEKCGYKKCGRLTRDIKFQDGKYTDRILMEQFLIKK